MSIAPIYCDSNIVTHHKKMHKYIILIGRALVTHCPKITAKNLQLTTRHDLFMHLLAMSRNGQVTADDCNE